MEISAKLRKILVLAKQGVEGEKDNALRILQKYLDANNLTMADLDDADEKILPFEFTYNTEYERRLLAQIIFACEFENWDGHYYRYKYAKKTLHYKFTRAQYIEVSFLYDLHKKALTETLGIAYSAYIVKNGIFGEQDDDEDTPRTKEDRERSRKILAMVEGIDKTKVYKEIESNKELEE